MTSYVALEALNRSVTFSTVGALLGLYSGFSFFSVEALFVEIVGIFCYKRLGAVLTENPRLGHAGNTKKKFNG